MKILCDHCGAKYTIADEKVRGRVFKLRCKKCGEAIIIRGDEAQAAPPEASEGGSSVEPSAPPKQLGPEEGVWHLVIDRRQVGPMDAEEVRALFDDGRITLDNFAWREGFEEWLKLSAIEEFSSLRPSHTPNHASATASEHGSEESEEERPEESTRRTSADDVFAAHQEAGAHEEEEDEPSQELFGARAAEPVSARDPAPAAAKNEPPAPVPVPAKRPEAGSTATPVRRAFHEAATVAPTAARLAQVARDGDSEEEEEEEEESESAPNGPRVTVDSMKLTGQRRENSVLFSLNNLEALGAEMRGGKSSSAASAPRPGHANANSGGSGLIDIRAMAAIALSGKDGMGARSGAIDPGPVFAPSVATPIMMPTPSGLPTWMWAMIGGGALVLLSMGGLVAVLLLRRPLPIVPPPATELPVSAEKPVVVAALDKSPPVVEPLAVEKPAPETPAPASRAPAAEPSAAAPKRHLKGEAHASARHEKASAPAAGSVSAAVRPAPVVRDDPPPPPTRKARGRDAELDELLSRPAPRPSAAPSKAKIAEDDPNLPETLGRGDVMAGMAGVQPRALACHQQYHVAGTAMVKVTIAKNGRVSTAAVQGALAGTPTGECVARAVRGASFKKFRGTPMTITYPFILR